MISPIPYTFILGMSHSGSTLLAFLLNAHPDIVSVGETSRITELLPIRWKPNHSRCSCGKSYYDCLFWNRCLAGMAVRGHGLGEPDFFLYASKQKKLANEKLKAFVEAALQVSGARAFLDASKHNQLVKPLVENPYLDLRILNLYRDGRGVINSWRKNQDSPDQYGIIQRYIRQETLRKSALSLIPANRQLVVRYEDLTAEPQNTLRTIFEFIELDPTANVVKGFKTQVEHHIIGNRMRSNTDETIHRDLSWREELPPDWLEQFDNLGGRALNQSLGYQD